MKKPALCVLPLMLILYGCQHGAPAKQTEPTIVPPASHAPAEVAPAATPVPASAPAAVQPVAASKPVETAAPVPVTVPPAPVAPKPVVVAPVVKPETKPEVKAEAVLSDAEGRKLAQRDNCFACHAIDKKVVGPAWKDIAAKYRGRSNAEAALIEKVAKGSSGVWGSSPMPPNARVSAEDIRALVRFILSLK